MTKNSTAEGHPMFGEATGFGPVCECKAEKANPSIFTKNCMLVCQKKHTAKHLKCFCDKKTEKDDPPKECVAILERRSKEYMLLELITSHTFDKKCDAVEEWMVKHGLSYNCELKIDEMKEGWYHAKCGFSEAFYDRNELNLFDIGIPTPTYTDRHEQASSKTKESRAPRDWKNTHQHADHAIRKAAGPMLLILLLGYIVIEFVIRYRKWMRKKKKKQIPILKLRKNL